MQLPSQRNIPFGTRELKRAADFLNLFKGKGWTWEKKFRHLMKVYVYINCIRFGSIAEDERWIYCLENVACSYARHEAQAGSRLEEIFKSWFKNHRQEDVLNWFLIILRLDHYNAAQFVQESSQAWSNVNSGEKKGQVTFSGPNPNSSSKSYRMFPVKARVSCSRQECTDLRQPWIYFFLPLDGEPISLHVATLPPHLTHECSVLPLHILSFAWLTNQV